MSKWLLTSIAVTSIPLIAGCTPPIFKTVDVDQGHGYSIDAQQRLILVTDEGGPNGDQRIVSAEPSPDALTAQAAAIAAQGGTPTVGIGFGGGSSEAAASIGLRTQTIQPGLPIWVELLVTSAPDFAMQIKVLVRAKGRDLGARDG